METVVLILAYNEADTIQEAIESIVGQDNPEILFVDDASTDDTAEIAKEALEASGLPYNFIQNAENFGIIESAKSAYQMIEHRNCFFMRLDGDDVLPPGAIRTLKKGYEEGKFIAAPYLETYADFVDQRNPTHIYECLACGVLMRTRDINKVGGLVSDDVGIFIEYDLYARLEDAGIKAKILKSSPVYQYNRYAGSITTNWELVNESLNKIKERWGYHIAQRIREY